jgi:HEAT repeat protein
LKKRETNIVKKNISIIAPLCLALLMAFSVASWAQTENKTMGIEEALSQLPVYEQGKSRLALSRISQQVVDTLNKGDEKERRALSLRLVSYLNSTSATVQSKRFVLRQLSLVGRGEAVASIVPLLNDKDLGSHAVLALGDNPDRKADAALLAALEDQRGQTRVGIINALANRSSSSAIPALEKLMDDKEKQTAMAAINALGRLGGPQARKALNSALDRTTGSTHFQVADALMREAERLVGKGNNNIALKIYRKLYDQKEPGVIRQAALVGITETAGESSWKDLFAALQGEDTGLRRVARQQLTTLKGKGVTAKIQSELGKADSDVKISLLQALKSRKDRNALPSIVALTKHEDPQVRIAALQAIQPLGGAGAVAIIANALIDEDEAVSQTARICLDSLPGEGVDETIVHLTGNANPKVRAELAASLGARNAKGSTDTLMKMAQEDSESSVRIAAIESLASLSSPDDLEEVVGLLLNAKSEDEISAAQAAVIKISGQIEDRKQRAEKILVMLPKAEGESKGALLAVLGKIGGKEAQAAVTVLLNDSDDNVKKAAVKSLADWPDNGPMETLIKVAENDDSLIMKVLALRGYINLVGLKSKRTPDETMACYKRAMKAAQRDDEKRKVLSPLAKMPHPEALNMAVQSLQNSGLRKEALVAIMGIAPSIAVSHTDAVVSALKKARSAARDEKTKKKIDGYLAHAGQSVDFITSWKVSGPYKKAKTRGNKIHAIEFAPEKADNNARWSVLPVAYDAKALGHLNLNIAPYAGTHRTAYLKTSVYSPQAQKLVLATGSDDSIKVWLNGRQVFSFDEDRSAVIDTDNTEVKLNKGWNSLTLKVTNLAVGWGAYARFKTLDGKTYVPLKVDANR